jgi:hypothetical protein
MRQRYKQPSAVTCDAVYCFEEGGLNPVRGEDSSWFADQAPANPLIRYRAAQSIRNSYQGFWQLKWNERPPLLHAGLDKPHKDSAILKLGVARRGPHSAASVRAEERRYCSGD